jgi:hypothetical protein
MGLLGLHLPTATPFLQQTLQELRGTELCGLQLEQGQILLHIPTMEQHGLQGL